MGERQSFTESGMNEFLGETVLFSEAVGVAALAENEWWKGVKASGLPKLDLDIWWSSLIGPWFLFSKPTNAFEVVKRRRVMWWHKIPFGG